MQITKEIVNNSEIRLYLTISKFKTILLVCLISFTSLLVRQTLQIQHSCNPMIHWSGELPAKCQVAVKTNFDNFDNFNSPTKQELKTSRQQPSIAPKTVRSETQFDSHPNQITYGPPAPISESLQRNTETKSKNTLEKVSEKAMEFVKDHPAEVAGGSLVVGAALTVAALPLIGIPLAIAGVGVAIFSIFH